MLGEADMKGVVVLYNSSDRLVKGVGLTLSVIFSVGFGFIPVYFAFMV